MGGLEGRIREVFAARRMETLYFSEEGSVASEPSDTHYIKVNPTHPDLDDSDLLTISFSRPTPWSRVRPFFERATDELYANIHCDRERFMRVSHDNEYALFYELRITKGDESLYFFSLSTELSIEHTLGGKKKIIEIDNVFGDDNFYIQAVMQIFYNAQDPLDKMRELIKNLPALIQRGVLEIPMNITPDCTFEYIVIQGYENYQEMVVDPAVDFDSDILRALVFMDSFNADIRYQGGSCTFSAYLRPGDLGRGEIEKFVREYGR